MTEFTGERVIPGQVDQDLWNEHLARYAFAARLARGKRVLDIGCGAGYGAAELARYAHRVTALDVAESALAYAREHFPLPNLQFVRGSCAALPLAAESFQLVTAFEVIEHVSDWAAALAEARRVLHPSGQFAVSTPNRLYYAESRRLSGPNPYHEHEFDFEEFRAELARFFPHVRFFLQNHTQAVAFRPLDPTGATECRIEDRAAGPGESHFFVAVCALSPQLGSPTFLYVPSAANVLRERELHIQRLEGELRTKDQWLEEARRDKQEVVEMFRQQTAELEARNRWAEELDRGLKDAYARIAALQEELALQQDAANAMAAGYEAKLAELEADLAAKARWAIETEQRLSGELAARAAELAAKCEELARCVELLDQAEKTVEERTNWALRLDGEVRELQARLSMVEASRWYRVGRALGLGPEVRKH